MQLMAWLGVLLGVQVMKSICDAFDCGLDSLADIGDPTPISKRIEGLGGTDPTPFPTRSQGLGDG